MATPKGAVAQIPPPSFRTPEGTRVRVPNKYTPALARKICEQLMIGKSMKAICAEPGMPSFMTITRWLANPQDDGFQGNVLLRPASAGRDSR